MADIYQTTHATKVPLGAVVDPGAILHRPTVGQQLGDPWVHVKPGTKVDLSQWPDDRTVLPAVKGKQPQKLAGKGSEIKDKLISRGALVPATVELRPDPAIQRTHPQTNIYRADGSVRTEPVLPDDHDEKVAKPAAKAKKGGK